MPRNDLADAVINMHKGGGKELRSVTRLWGRDPASAIVQHKQHLEEDILIIEDLIDQGLQLDVMRDNAEAASELLTKTVNNVMGRPEQIVNRALWEPLTGTVDNLGLVQIKDFFELDNPYSTKDINDFALFDAPERSDINLASKDKAIEKLQRLLHRLIRPNDSRDPFVSAHHEYLVDLDDPPQQPTGSQTCLFPAVILLSSNLLISFCVLFPIASLPSAQPSGAAQSKERTDCMSPLLFVYLVTHQTSPGNAQYEFLKLFRDFFLPILVAEYKKDKDQISIQGPNQVRSYLVAALKFLAACDITEFLVLSLYTEGTVGVVQAGWKDRVRLPPVRIFRLAVLAWAHRMIRKLTPPRVELIAIVTLPRVEFISLTETVRPSTSPTSLARSTSPYS